MRQECWGTNVARFGANLSPDRVIVDSGILK
jgi:hypothetical protein